MANLTDDEVIQQFVVRQKEFDRIISEIRRDDMSGSIQHYVVIGRRGSGKSTLLRRIEAEINRDNKLRNRLITVNLSEEQAGIYRLFDLWDYILRFFKSMKISVIDEPSWKETDTDENYSKAMYSSIQKTIQKVNKKLLLLLDNIDRIFDNIGDDAHFLREILTNYKDIRIIGASTRMSEYYWHYDKPFYQFFGIIRLESLDPDEMRALLFHWANCLQNTDIEDFVKMNPGKIDMIRVLTDGNPRTLQYFVDLLIDRQKQKGYEYLQIILDGITPIYQERLNFFPPAQRKIIIELANFWEAVKVRMLSEVCKMPGKTISAQLNQLEKDGIVEKIKGLSKDHLYRLAERFFNLWLLMTQGGPREKRKVKYLTIFLENWYDQEEFKKLFIEHVEGNKMHEYNSGYIAVHSTANRTKEADHYYNKAIENGHKRAMFILVLKYYNNNEHKQKAFEIANRYLSSTDDVFAKSLQIIMLLWKSEIKEASEKVEITFPYLIDHENIELLSFLIIELMVHKQNNLVWQLFNNEQYGSKLKEMALPLYYVCAGFLAPKERGEELLKAGTEISESIELLRADILSRQEHYQ
jgi:hypothetical protein